MPYSQLGMTCKSATIALTSNKKYLLPDALVYSCDCCENNNNNNNNTDILTSSNRHSHHNPRAIKAFNQSKCKSCTKFL